jgi:hypothetical protein
MRKSAKRLKIVVGPILQLRQVYSAKDCGVMRFGVSSQAVDLPIPAPPKPGGNRFDGEIQDASAGGLADRGVAGCDLILVGGEGF